MELYQLRTFVAVAEEGHLTRAAKRIHASQSTVSAHIKALEDEWGVTLFTRTPRGMLLSDQGSLLLVRAREALAATEMLLNTANSLREDLTGTARVGLNACPDLLRGAQLMAALKKQHPLLQVQYNNSMSHQVLADISAGTLDAGFVFGDYPGDFEGILVVESRVRIVAPTAWKERLAQTPWEELASLPWVWTPPECPFTKIAEAMFPEREKRPTKAAVVDNETVMLALVAAGNGMALMREDEALQAEARGEVVLRPECPGRLPLSFVHHARRSQDRLIAALTSAVRTVWSLPQQTKTRIPTECRLRGDRPPEA